MNNSIKQLRNAMGITQEEFAARVGVSRQTIIAIEAGNYNPSLQLAFKIAKLFEKRVEEVFKEDE